MLDPLLVVELAPLLLSGMATLGAALYLWLRGPRTGLTNSLTLVLIFLGHLALVAAMVALPNDPGFAHRLLPVFQLATVGATLSFLVFLCEPRMDARRVDAMLSTVIIGIVALIGLTLWRPELYWGDTAHEPGPLFATTGIRTALFAFVAWILGAHALARHDRFPHVPRGGAYLLSAGFALVAMHDAVTSTLRSFAEGTPQASAGFLGAPFLVALFVHLALVARFGPGAAPRRHARQYLLVGLMPALLGILAVDLIVFRLVPADRAAQFLDLALRHLWMIALAAGTAWMLPRGRRIEALDRPTPRAVPDAEPQVQRALVAARRDPRA